MASCVRPLPSPGTAPPGNRGVVQNHMVGTLSARTAIRVSVQVIVGLTWPSPDARHAGSCAVSRRQEALEPPAHLRRVASRTRALVSAKPISPGRERSHPAAPESARHGPGPPDQGDSHPPCVRCYQTSRVAGHTDPRSGLRIEDQRKRRAGAMRLPCRSVVCVLGKWAPVTTAHSIAEIENVAYSGSRSNPRSCDR
jgi:hypothetical protein